MMIKELFKGQVGDYCIARNNSNACYTLNFLCDITLKLLEISITNFVGK